jgi:cobyrinic acid a,c-diamide synthase
MRAQVLAFSRSGRPVYGECGGFMYLCKGIADSDGQQQPMVGVYPVLARMSRRLRRLGYRQTKMRTKTLLGPAGSVLHGHEFHYSEIEPMPEQIERAALLDDGRCECYLTDKTLAGYVHLHWGQTPEAALYFVQAMCL